MPSCRALLQCSALPVACYSQVDLLHLPTLTKLAFLAGQCLAALPDRDRPQKAEVCVEQLVQRDALSW